MAEKLKDVGGGGMERSLTGDCGSELTRNVPPLKSQLGRRITVASSSDTKAKLMVPKTYIGMMPDRKSSKTKRKVSICFVKRQLEEPISPPPSQPRSAEPLILIAVDKH